MTIIKKLLTFLFAFTMAIVWMTVFVASYYKPIDIPFYEGIVVLAIVIQVVAMRIKKYENNKFFYWAGFLPIYTLVRFLTHSIPTPAEDSYKIVTLGYISICCVYFILFLIDSFMELGKLIPPMKYWLNLHKWRRMR